MFKLPDGIPSLKSTSQDWADYAEYFAIQNGKISFLRLLMDPSLVDDEAMVAGIEDDTDKFNNKIEDVCKEITRRKSIMGDRYPFELTDRDYSLTYNSNNSIYDWLYKFLLLSTRVKMSLDRIQAGIDGALLFETLSGCVAKSFFGEKSKVEILGTSKANVGGFRNKLSIIIKKMGEGGSVHENHGFHPQDDKVDVIVWKGFSDQMPSQMIAFGQCKTGTSWQHSLSQLNPEAFCKTWFTSQPVHTPIRMFFCAQYFPIPLWRPRANDVSGIVFDRFRIMEYFPENIEVDDLIKIKNWCNAVNQKFQKVE